MEKVEQTIMMSLSDITVIGHATEGGKYIRKANSSFGTVVWVSGTEWVGSIVKSLTLYFGYIGGSCGASIYPGRTVYLVYSCATT